MERREFNVSGEIGERRAIIELGVTVVVTWANSGRWSATIEAMSPAEQERQLYAHAPQLRHRASEQRKKSD